MLECLHENTEVRDVEKEFLGMVFKTETKVCLDCGAYLRGPEYERAYKKWLEDVYKSKRPKFQVQCHFSDNLIRCAEAFLKEHPGISITVYLRILATAYLHIVDGNEMLSERFEDLLDKEIFATLSDSEGRNRVTIQFKPAMMADIVDISEVFEMRLSHVVEEGVLKMMSAIMSKDPKMNTLWDEEVNTTLEVLLKSA